MAGFASLPDGFDTPTVTYAIQDPATAISKLPGIRNVPWLESALTNLTETVPGVEVGLEMPLTVNPGRIVQESIFKVTLNVPDQRGYAVQGDVQLELQFSPANAVTQSGAWSVKLLQNVFENGPNVLESVAHSLQLNGIEPIDIARIAREAAQGDVLSGVQRLFGGADDATYKISANHDVDAVHDAAVRTLGRALPSAGALFGGFGGPGGSGLGFKIGSAAEAAANVIAIGTRTSIETGRSATIVNVNPSEMLQTSAGPRPLGETLILGRDAGAAIELPMPPFNVFSAAVNAMQETPLDEAFPNQQRLIEREGPFATEQALLGLVVNPGYNGGSERVAAGIARQQLDQGTDVWDLMVATVHTESQVQSGTHSGYGILVSSPEYVPTELSLAYTIANILDQAGRIPYGTRASENVIGTGTFSQDDLLVFPGSTETARAMLDDLVTDYRAVGDTQSVENIAQYLFETGAGELRLNFGIPELDRLVKPLGPPSTEGARQAAIFNRETEAPGTYHLLSRDFRVVDEGRVLASPIPGRKQEHVYVDQPGVRTTEEVLAAGDAIVRDREFRIGPFRIGEAPPELELAALRDAGRAIPSDVALASAGRPLTADQSRELGATVQALASELGGDALGDAVLDALRTGDVTALRADAQGTLVADALAGIGGDGASREAVLSGAEASRADVRPDGPEPVGAVTERDAPEPRALGD